MVSVLAAIRPDDWNFPLLMHVFGAMILVGGLVAAVTALLLGWRRDSLWYSRLGFWSLLLVAFPAWWVMRIGAEWIYSKEDFASDPDWVGIGYSTSEGGGLLLLIAIIVTGIGVRRLRTANGETTALTRVGGVLATLILIAYVITVWAMTAKPG
jgi:hypothetical protein